MKRPLAALGLAVTFLTIVPLPLRQPLPALGGAAPWFPVVGAAVGALAGGINYLLQPSLGPSVSAVLAVLVLVGITGACTKTGWPTARTGWARNDRVRRLALMRDPTVGTFGVLALGLWLLLVSAAVAGFAPNDAWAALVAAAAVARWAALLHAAGTPPARRRHAPTGLARPSRYTRRRSSWRRCPRRSARFWPESSLRSSP